MGCSSMKQTKDELGLILDELYTATQSLKDFQYILTQLYESYPVAGDSEIKAVVTCCKTYIAAVEGSLTEQLDAFDELLTSL